MGSETTAAATGQVGVVRRDPMAMLPFCGYNMADYWRHYLNVGNRLTRPPKIFSVNWFRVDDRGKFIWPGFGDNMRVLKWVVDRVNGSVPARETPAGLVPRVEDLDMTGLDLPKAQLEKLFAVDMKEWKPEVEGIRTFFKPYRTRLPSEIRSEFERLERQTR
jgi:phosphoenolpyruvate carboxykinase (GTP)